MALQRPLLTDFSAGEVGKKFYGRSDLDIYARGCQKLENWIPFTQGGITTRPPTRYLGETVGNVAARFIPFVVGATVFEVELTPLALRLWQADTPVVSVPTSPIVTTYTADDIPFIQYQKVANQLFLVCRGYPIKVLTWHGSNTFSFENLNIVFGTGVDGWVGGTAYEVDDVVVTSTTPKRAYKCISAGTSGSLPPTLEQDDVTDGTVHWSWEFTQPFSQDGDYPGSVAYFNGRMCFAGSTLQPDTGWMSQPYDFGGFDFFSIYSYTGVQLVDASLWADPEVPETETISYRQTIIGEANAIVFQLASENDESIMWMAGTDALIIGTGTSEWVVTKEITALNVDQCVHLRSRIGSAEQQAMVPMQHPLFLQGTANKAFLYEYAYNSENAELDSADMTYLSEHMLSAGVSQMDFVQMPQPMWIGVTDGKLAVLLYAKKYHVASWFWIVTDGTIVSVCVVPGTTDDAIYIVVLRNGRYCIERFETLWGTTPMVDSYHSVAAAPASTTGLERFNGETVWIYNKTHLQWYAGGAVVAGVLDTSAHLGDEIWIGLAYTHSMQSLSLQTGSSVTGGSAQGLLKRISAVTARVLESYPFKVGYSQTINLELAKTIDGTTWTDSYSGDVRIPFQGKWSREGYLWIVQDQRQKTTILALFPEVDA